VNNGGFIAGGLSKCFNFWKFITSDHYVHKLILGYEPNGYKAEVVQIDVPSDIVPDSDKPLMDREIQSLLDMKVIEKCEDEDDQFISNVFLVPKSDGSCRKILNLKRFNKFIPYEHFKMEGLDSALELVYEGCYFASVDLRKAYYSVVMNPNFRKYLRFRWRELRYLPELSRC